MDHLGAWKLGAWRRRLAVLALPACLAGVAGPACAATQLPQHGDVIVGTRLQTSAAPLPELTPFQVRPAAVAQAGQPPATEEAAGAPLALTSKEVLLAAAAVLAFVALRYRG